MKTSTSQFLTILDCMERNRDLNKPAQGPFGRLEQIKKWADLIKVLNMDVTGEAKPKPKWKKVWSDLKNNTKRKAGRIHTAASATGGGPPTKLVLSDLELRVLNIIGSQAATGLIDVEEVGALSHSSVPRPVSTTLLSTEPNIPLLHTEISPSNHNTIESEVGLPGTASPQANRSARPSPRPRRVFRRRSASRRARTPRVDAATRHFTASDERWRNLISELVTEHLRLRERELEQQAQWQVLFSRCIDALSKFTK